MAKVFIPLLSNQIMNRRQRTGELGESLARKYVNSLGYTLLDSNFRNRYGELDLVYFNQDALVFCEVKTCLSSSRSPFTSPELSVGPQKQRRIRRMAAFWLAEKGAHARRVCETRTVGIPLLRFDVIGVSLDTNHSAEKITLIRDAF